MNSSVRPPCSASDVCQGIDVVEAQQATIGHQDDVLNGEPLQDRGQHGLQRLGLGHVARMHGMHQRQALGGLYDAQDKLAGDAAGLFVHAIGADVLLDLAFSVDAHGGQFQSTRGRICLTNSVSNRSTLSMSTSIALRRW